MDVGRFASLMLMGLWLGLSALPLRSAPPPAPTLPPQVVQVLALSPGQQQRLQQLRATYQPKLLAMRHESQRHRQALARPTATAERQRLQQRLNQTQTNLRHLQAELLGQLRRLLTPLQQEKLALMLTGTRRLPTL